MIHTCNNETIVNTFDLIGTEPTHIKATMDEAIRINIEELLDVIRPHIETRIDDNGGYKIVRSTINIFKETV